MSILTISRYEQPNTSFCPSNAEAQAKIEADIRAFKRAGGEIQQIPTGKSAYNLQVRQSKEEGRGTRVTWEDKNLHMSSQQAKNASVRSMEQKKARGGPGRPREPRDERFQRAKNLMDEGKSMRETCRILGIARGTLRHWLDTDEDVK
jgi:hypothetical protein